MRTLLESCGGDLPGLRDRALLSVAYDTGLRASELVAVEFSHIIEAIDPEARLLMIARSEGDQEGEGATAYLSPRSVRAIAAWRAAARIEVPRRPESDHADQPGGQSLDYDDSNGRRPLGRAKRREEAMDQRIAEQDEHDYHRTGACLLYTSPSPRDS